MTAGTIRSPHRYRISRKEGERSERAVSQGGKPSGTPSAFDGSAATPVFASCNRGDLGRRDGGGSGELRGGDRSHSQRLPSDPTYGPGRTPQGPAAQGS